MEIIKILSDKRIRCLSSGRTNYYNAYDFRTVLDSISFYAEKEDVLLVPFYITSENKLYELYEYELNITVFNDNLTCARPAGISKDTSEDRIKYCYINTICNKDNIISHLKKYVDFVLSLPNLPAISEKLCSYLGEFEPDRLYFTIY